MEKTDTKIELFDFLVNMFANMLKQLNQNSVVECEQALTNLLGYECTREIINAAIFQVSELSPQTGRWICENFPDFEACIQLKEYSVMLATQELIKKGFILGKDFSITADGKLVINQQAKTALIQRLYLWEQVWVESILLIQN
ncbi:MAG: hypothetical protein WBA39_26070 [Rivularia sp. (in: cyanobacteria)]